MQNNEYPHKASQTSREGDCRKTGDDNNNDVATSYVEVTIGKQTVNKPTIESNAYTGIELTADVPASELYEISDNTRTNAGSYHG
ncbi:MAG: hypothetical protein IJ299_02520 [Oscillospiraceae bacterium]|nr:hypothetical protein [Oscillospiraceae bacterium]